MRVQGKVSCFLEKMGGKNNLGRGTARAKAQEGWGYREAKDASQRTADGGFRASGI